MARLDRSGIWFILVLLTAASFPWHERINTIGVVLLVLHWLWDRNILHKIRQVKLDLTLGLFWGFWTYHLICLIGSDFQGEGLHSIEVKLTFLILPLIFSTENYLSPAKRRVVEWTFILSCMASLIYAAGFTLVTYKQNPIAALTHRMTFSEPIMHPGYYSNFIGFAVLLLIQDWLGEKNKSKMKVGIYLLVLLVLAIGLIILVSKTAILFMAFVAVYSLWQFTKSIRNVLLRVGTFVLVVVVFLISMYSIPNLRERVLDTTMNARKIPPKEVYFYNSTGSRIAAWSLTWDLISKKPILGYGTGAANPLLLEQMKAKGYVDLVKYNMHTHNQLLHTWMDLGLIGMILLMTWLGWMGYRFAITLKDTKGVFMMLLVLINLATDDMLEIQAGVVFFIFFTALYAFKDVGYKRPVIYTY